MPEFRGPGVYVEETSTPPPAVAAVATAVPVFIGSTARARGRDGADLARSAVRVASLAEYEALFGKAPLESLSVVLEKRVAADGGLLGVSADWAAPPGPPRQFMPYALRLYFDNGGGPCFVYSIGRYGRARTADFVAAIQALSAVEGPTLLVFSDAVKLGDAGCAAVLDAALSACAGTRDRFAIADLPGAVAGGNDSLAAVETAFRARITGDVSLLQYGAAYFPYLESAVPLRSSPARVSLRRFDVVTVAPDGSESVAALPGAAGRRLNDRALDLRAAEPEAYQAVETLLDTAFAVVPPSGAVAGLYARTDAARGVWQAPAGEALSGVRKAAVAVNDRFQEALNVDAASGKSVNAIRDFAGRGTLVWGARTLAGNDNEWRYVNVRRLAIFLERSLRQGLHWAVFEPNDADTWARVRAAAEAFLIGLWREGAFQGDKPEQAFTVDLGLGRTMTQDDVDHGRLVLQVGVAPLRPAEFIVLRIVLRLGAL